VELHHKTESKLNRFSKY